MSVEEKRRLLERFAAAWNAHDADEVLACMVPDCLFYAAAGEDSKGTLAAGHAGVRVACESLWRDVPDATWHIVEHIVAGDRGFSTWLFTGTTVAGERIETHGVDIFAFRGDLIAVKDTYRKAVRKG